ncbi:ankyrin repeat domain-containing protein SOWAHC [Corythoichthys intestinalis]|uniref:ankyrin repeat domain-containing protein SOWAHC n=1 Tax=Corythoichthys intestinalis TaxID=161448 RepID=UPI0025A6462E|nr:ankyrin repeat domain-containing protein SOWAHC [Corythoichthys intestinalis]
MSDVSEESLLDYFYATAGSSGKVKNADILKTFKPFIGHSDAQLRAKYREEFKLIIDRIAVVKSENGEKYLFLKKKYRQLLQARDKDKTRTPDVDNTVLAKAQGDVTDSFASASQQRECQDELITCSEPDSVPEWESEQDEESTGSMGSAAVALDPLEKEWIYFAAGARVLDLSQLLRQDPSLANKKDFTSFTALHWAAKHGNEDMANLIANAGADVNTKSHVSILWYVWQECGCSANKSSHHVMLIVSHNKFVSSMHCSETMQFSTNYLAIMFLSLYCVSTSFSNLYFLSTLFALAARGAGKLQGGYTPLHIAALHGHQNILHLLVGTYGAKDNLRDYSGRLPLHYLNPKEAEGPLEEDSDLPEFQVSQARERNRNRKLASLFQSKKKWGSAEDLAPIEEERTPSHQLALPAFRPRKFSR